MSNHIPDGYIINTDGSITESKSGNKKKTYKDKDGYSILLLSKKGKLKSYRVHRLVAYRYLSNPYNKPQVNHKDGNKSNNNVDNLEWATASENVKHAFDTGLKSVSERHKKILSEKAKKQFTGRIDTIGSKNGKSKLKEADIPIIRDRIKNNENMSNIAREYNVTPNCIWEIKVNKRWKHVS